MINTTAFPITDKNRKSVKTFTDKVKDIFSDQNKFSVVVDHESVVVNDISFTIRYSPVQESIVCVLNHPFPISKADQNISFNQLKLDAINSVDGKSFLNDKYKMFFIKNSHTKFDLLYSDSGNEVSLSLNERFFFNLNFNIDSDNQPIFVVKSVDFNQNVSPKIEAIYFDEKLASAHVNVLEVKFANTSVKATYTKLYDSGNNLKNEAN